MNENGMAEIDFSAVFSPSDAVNDICWEIEGIGLGGLTGHFAGSDMAYHYPLPVTDQVRDFAVIAWLDEDHDNQWDSGEDKRKVEVHVCALDVGTMSVVNGKNTSTGWLAKEQKNNAGAWVPLNTDNDAYQFIKTTKPKEDRREWSDTNNVSFLDNDLLPIRITPAGNGTSFSLDFDQSIIRIFTTEKRTGKVTPGVDFTVTEPKIYYVEGFGGKAGKSTTITLNATVAGKKTPVDKVKINIFTWKGPQNVPNYATYKYTASGGTPGCTWVTPYKGAFSGTQTPSTANILWNSNAAVVGLAEYKAAAQYTWGYDVNVVAVTPQAGSMQINMDQGVQYMYANLPVAISGPLVDNQVKIGDVAQPIVQRGVQFIQVGFMQTLTFVSQDATFRTKTAPTQTITATQYFDGVAMNGTTALDMVTDPTSRRPWYFSKTAMMHHRTIRAFYDCSIYRTTGEIGTNGVVALQATDVPWMNPNLGSFLNPADHKHYYYKTVDFRWNLTMYLGVHTTEDSNGSASVYTPRAKADWTYTRQGVPSAANMGVRAVTTPTFSVITTGIPFSSVLLNGAVANIRMNSGKFGPK